MNKVGIKVFVNLLTVSRLIFTFAMPFLINRVQNMTFLIIVAILFFSDCIDGLLSRCCKVQTLFGSIMDTIADKVLTIILIVCIANSTPVIYTMLIGEIIIAVINLIGTLNGATIVSIMLGKAKMWALAIATLLGYMYYFNICKQIYVDISSGIVIVMQVILFFMYGNKAIKGKKVELKKLVLKKGKELNHALFDTEYYLNTIDIPLIQKLSINGN